MLYLSAVGQCWFACLGFFLFIYITQYVIYIFSSPHLPVYMPSPTLTQHHVFSLTCTLPLSQKWKQDWTIIKDQRCAFLLGKCSCTWGLIVVNIPSAIPLTNTDLPFHRTYGFQIGAWLGKGVCTYFSFSELWVSQSWACTGLAYAVIISVSICGHWSCCVWKMLFL